MHVLLNHALILDHGTSTMYIHYVCSWYVYHVCSLGVDRSHFNEFPTRRYILNQNHFFFRNSAVFRNRNRYIAIDNRIENDFITAFINTSLALAKEQLYISGIGFLYHIYSMFILAEIIVASCY